MRPRSWIESFLAIAALGGLAFGLAWKLFTGDPAEDSTLIGLAFGAVAGLVGAPKLREVSVVRPVPDRAQFLEALEPRLAELDIFPVQEVGDFRSYETKAGGSFSLGPISVNGLVKRVRVRFNDGNATIVAPRNVLNALNM